MYPVVAPGGRRVFGFSVETFLLASLAGILVGAIAGCLLGTVAFPIGNLIGLLLGGAAAVVPAVAIAVAAAVAAGIHRASASPARLGVAQLLGLVGLAGAGIICGPIGAALWHAGGPIVSGAIWLTIPGEGLALWLVGRMAERREHPMPLPPLLPAWRVTDRPVAVPPPPPPPPPPLSSGE